MHTCRILCVVRKKTWTSRKLESHGKCITESAFSSGFNVNVQHRFTENITLQIQFANAPNCSIMMALLSDFQNVPTLLKYYNRHIHGVYIVMSSTCHHLFSC